MGPLDLGQTDLCLKTYRPRSELDRVGFLGYTRTIASRERSDAHGDSGMSVKSCMTLVMLAASASLLASWLYAAEPGKAEKIPASPPSPPADSQLDKVSPLPIQTWPEPPPKQEISPFPGGWQAPPGRPKPSGGMPEMGSPSGAFSPVRLRTGALTYTGHGATSLGPPFSPVRLRTSSVTYTGQGATSLGPPLSPVRLRTGTLTYTGRGTK